MAVALFAIVSLPFSSFAQDNEFKHEQSAAEAAAELAGILDGASLNGDGVIVALKDAADAGQPIAMWQLGLMYENGMGVAKDDAVAFQYFSKIANDNADALPSSLDADIVAQSFLKIGDYFLHGSPEAGIHADQNRGQALILHAASYFGDADAQYRAGLLFLNEEELGLNHLQGARWFALAARKGHILAQARLGDLLVHGQGIENQVIEGLMWLTVAKRRAAGTSDEAWISDLSNTAFSTAKPFEVESAIRAADNLTPKFAGL